MSSLAGMLLLFIFIFDLLAMQLSRTSSSSRGGSYGVEGAEPLCSPLAEEHRPTRERSCARRAAAMAEAWVFFNADTGAAGKRARDADPDDGEGTRLCGARRRRAAAMHHFDDFFWSFITSSRCSPAKTGTR